MWTSNFWKATAERALKSAAQAIIGLMVGDTVFDIWQADYKKALGVAVGAAVLSVLTSVVSAPVGSDKDSPSLTESK